MIAKHIDRFPLLKLDQVIDWQPIEQYLSDDLYPTFKELNRKTITNPLADINNNALCDLLVSVEYFRSGRTVTNFRFHVKEKELDLVDLAELSASPNPCFKHMRICYNSSKQTQLLEKYSPEEIEAIIQRANEYIDTLASTKGDAKTNLSGVYFKAFAEGWGLEELQGKKAREEAKRIKKEKQIQEQAEADLKTEAKAKYRKSIETAFFSLDKDQQEAILDSIEMVLDPIFSKIFKKDRKAGIIPTSLFTFHLAKVEEALFQQFS